MPHPQTHSSTGSLIATPMVNSFSSRLKLFTQRLRETTQIPNFFADQSPSESQNLAKELAEAGECVLQLSQVVMEVEILNQLHSRLVYEREVLQQEKTDLETRVFELQQERSEIEPQVMYLREQLSQASIQLEQTQNRERNLSDRERQLTEIVAQLERRRAVLNQTIENLTNQEADYTVRTKELSQIVTESDKKAKQYMEAVNSYKSYLEELQAQVIEEQSKLKAMGVNPLERSLPDIPTPPPPEAPPLPPRRADPAPAYPASGSYWDEPTSSPFSDNPWG
ncbi:MAG: hypothetical protein NW237_11235 [Cyanobacteriota bacterium]|nr:hypothetical protein [Cyanobacteriota bacterium]